MIQKAANFETFKVDDALFSLNGFVQEVQATVLGVLPQMLITNIIAGQDSAVKPPEFSLSTRYDSDRDAAHDVGLAIKDVMAKPVVPASLNDDVIIINTLLNSFTQKFKFHTHAGADECYIDVMSSIVDDVRLLAVMLTDVNRYSDIQRASFLLHHYNALCNTCLTSCTCLEEMVTSYEALAPGSLMLYVTSHLVNIIGPLGIFMPRLDGHYRAFELLVKPFNDRRISKQYDDEWVANTVQLLVDDGRRSHGMLLDCVAEVCKLSPETGVEILMRSVIYPAMLAYTGCTRSLSTEMISRVASMIQSAIGANNALKMSMIKERPSVATYDVISGCMVRLCDVLRSYETVPQPETPLLKSISNAARDVGLSILPIHYIAAEPTLMTKGFRPQCLDVTAVLQG